MKNVHTQTTPFTKKLGADNLRRTLALVQSMWELLDGENPMRIEHLWQKVFRAHRDFRGGAFMMHTLAGIEMALWDITVLAEAYHVPIAPHSVASSLGVAARSGARCRSRRSGACEGRPHTVRMARVEVF